MQVNCTLTSLHLPFNKLGADVAPVIGDALKVAACAVVSAVSCSQHTGQLNCTPTSLDLAFNSLGAMALP